MNNKETQHIVAKAGDNPLSCWNAGRLVVVPTETVYGLAADAENSEAVARIYALKDRPRFNPLIVHVSSKEMAQRYAIWNDYAEKVTSMFWPGALAIILPLKPNSSVSDLVTAGGDTIALRMPNHPVTLTLIESFGRGIAAPSANRSGRISPTCAEHVREEFAEQCPYIVDGGTCQVGIESTVIDLSGKFPEILRPGLVTKKKLFNALGLESNQIPKEHSAVFKSPGMLKSHYAPRLPVHLNACKVAPSEALIAFGPKPIIGAKTTINLSEKGDLEQAAASLFYALRRLDRTIYTAIAVMPIPNEGIGEAINDRLIRAAAERIS